MKNKGSLRRMHDEIYKIKLIRINLDYNFFFKEFKIVKINAIWANNYELYNRAELIMNILFFELFLCGKYSKTFMLNKGEKRERETKRRSIKIYKQFENKDISKCLMNLGLFSTFLQTIDYNVKISNESSKNVDLYLNIPKALSKFFNFKGSIPEVQVTNLKIALQMEHEIRETVGNRRLLGGLLRVGNR